MTVTFFPESDMDEIIYFDTLHQFNSDCWMSIGFTPMAKDIKTFIDDLNHMGYLNSMQDYSTTAVIDGNKARLGFSGAKLDPFKNDYSEQGEQLQQMAQNEGKNLKAIFQFHVSLQ